MKCLQCRKPMKASHEDHEYTECGLPNVVLRNALIYRCGKCNEWALALEGAEKIHREIALCVARKREKLTGQEIRFLRTYLGWSGADFAKKIGVDASTVSRWETGSQQMGIVAEKLLRILATVAQPESDYGLEEMGTFAAAPGRIDIVKTSDGWKPAAA